MPRDYQDTGKLPSFRGVYRFERVHLIYDRNHQDCDLVTDALTLIQGGQTQIDEQGVWKNSNLKD